MANTNAPFGFRQYAGTGSVPTMEQAVRKIASNNATAIFMGDPVVRLATGYIAQASSNSAANGVEGIFIGCKYLSVAQKRTVWSNYWPGSDAAADVEAYVITDPNAKFAVQNSSSSTAITLADLGANIGFSIGTGNTSTGLSGATVDQTTIATTNTLPFRILDLIVDPPGVNGTDSASGYNWVVVGFNNQAHRQLTGI